ncbi:4'-phosphopantetheinyl transferase superfamily [Dichotomocladium elegans]|nr:4'-phosphopantetheinyl transferase superfamily [Dichotomocladium elegans]
MSSSSTSLILLAFDTRHAFKGSQFDEALALLPSQKDRDAVLRFKYDNDRHLALGSQLLRRFVFSHYYGMQWNSLCFGYPTPGGKPNTDEYYDFNISHHGHWVILGATNQRGYSVGVDVVSIDVPHDLSVPDFIRCFDPQLSPGEKQLLRTHSHPLEAFYTLWGLKESYTKAIGVGIYHKLDTLSFSNTPEGIIKMTNGDKECSSWKFHLEWLDEKSLAIICYGCEKEHEPGLLAKRQAWISRSAEVVDKPQWIGEPFKGTFDSCFISVTLQDCKTISRRDKSLE